MRLPWRTTRTPIGLDIDERHVAAVQLEPANGPRPWRVSAAAWFARHSPGKPLESAEARQIGQTLDRQGFAGRRVVVPVPSDKLMSEVLELPPASSALPTAQIARIELARTQRCPPDSFEMACWELPATTRARRGAQVMAVGCAHKDAELLIEVLDAGGLEAIALDVRPCALARAVRPITAGQPAVCGVVDLAWNCATILMLHDEAIVYSGTLKECGTRNLHESLCARLTLDAEMADYLLSIGDAGPAADEQRPSAAELPEEAQKLLSSFADALGKELQAAMSYVGHAYPDASPGPLLLTGMYAGIAGLAPQLAETLGLAVRTVEPVELLEFPPSLQTSCTQPALIVAAGLAQHTGD